jgi:hypothetical protein
MWQIPESGCGFVLQDAGEERLMPRVCPEFRGRAARIFEWPRRSAKNTKAEERERFVNCSQPATGGKFIGTRMEMPDSPELPECGSDFILQAVDCKWVTLRDCPEMAERLKAKC